MLKVHTSPLETHRSDLQGQLDEINRQIAEKLAGGKAAGKLTLEAAQLKAQLANIPDLEVQVIDLETQRRKVDAINSYRKILASAVRQKEVVKAIESQIEPILEQLKPLQKELAEAERLARNLGDNLSFAQSAARQLGATQEELTV